MNHRIPVLLDGDPGHDDAIAWMLAATGLDIRGVSSAAGNQTIEKTTRNALRICTLLGIRAPVAMGLARPLLSEALTAPSVHGVSGLDGPALPEPDREAAPESAPEQMARLLRESAEPLTIVATAPLTNVAALLLAHPELKANIAGISLMGGGLAHGNWTPAAEFNILADPEAADVVFRSGLPITMAGCHGAGPALSRGLCAHPRRRQPRGGDRRGLAGLLLCLPPHKGLRRSTRARRRGRVRPAAA